MKRYTVNGYMYLVTPIGNVIPTINVDREEFVLASDFDAVVAEMEAETERLRKRITEMAALSQKHDRLILADTSRPKRKKAP